MISNSALLTVNGPIILRKRTVSRGPTGRFCRGVNFESALTKSYHILAEKIKLLVPQNSYFCLFFKYLCRRTRTHLTARTKSELQKSGSNSNGCPQLLWHAYFLNVLRHVSPKIGFYCHWNTKGHFVSTKATHDSIFWNRSSFMKWEWWRISMTEKDEIFTRLAEIYEIWFSEIFCLVSL